ncbi:MAG: hypothetical protein V7K55_23435 [Nostoc sp.]|uniref:hypothetical protein n=1 Tax=Nostoc sp. TaxID=1180 RepID=UPI002FF6523D
MGELIVGFAELAIAISCFGYWLWLFMVCETGNTESLRLSYLLLSEIKSQDSV